MINVQDVEPNIFKNPEYKVDLEKVVEEDKDIRVAVIRTSDRNAFRQCRRKWGWSSHLRQNMGPLQNATPLWFGSGFHFVMEDYHGYRRFENPVDALHAYVAATLKFDRKLVPDDYEEATAKGVTMLEYYLKWEERRKASLLPTYYVDGKPQVEVNFRIDIPLDPELLKEYGFDKAVYSGTIDRVVIDKELGLLWLLDYKTAAAFNTQHFQTDSQVTTYCWAASNIYSLPVAGMIYAQHLKKDIKAPKPLKSGKISTAQNQATTHILYSQALVEQFGSVEDAPFENTEYLNGLALNESEWWDKLIRFDKIPRSDIRQQSEGAKIMMEAVDMLNPNLALYPNPTWTCTAMCSFNSVCVGMDDGSDFESELAMNFQQRPKEYDGWRDHIIWPEEAAAKEKVKEEEAFDWSKNI